MPYFIQSAFAGLGPIIWHWGIGVGIILIILAVEYFLAGFPIVERFRKDLLWLAVAIALVLAGEWIGARDSANRCAAKAAVIERRVEDAVTRAKQPPKPGIFKSVPPRDPWDTNQ